MTTATLAIGDVARQAGVGVQTVRYYEQRGLLPPPTRRPSGQRTYAPEVVNTLRAVKTAQRLGFTLAEVDELLRLTGAAAREGGDNALQARMRAKLLQLDTRIGDLFAIRQRVAEVLHAGCDSLANCTCPNCPVLVQHDKAGAPA